MDWERVEERLKRVRDWERVEERLKESKELIWEYRRD